MLFWQYHILYDGITNITVEIDNYMILLTKKIMATFFGIAFMSYFFKTGHERLISQIQQKNIDITQKNQSIFSILSNIKHGIIPIIDGGRIDEHYSQYVEDLFETNLVKNESVINFIFKKSELGEDHKSQISSVLDASIGNHLISYEINRHILPKDLTVVVNGKKKYLELNWDSIENSDEEIYKILLIMRDVTEIRKIEAEDEKKTRSINMLTQLLVLNLERVSNFFEWCNINLCSVNNLLQSKEKYTINDAKKIFIILHTLKGTARMFSLSYIVDLVHKAEDKHHHFLNMKEQNEIDKNLLIDDLKVIMNTLNDYQEVYYSKLLSFSKSNDLEKKKLEKISKEIISLRGCLDDQNEVKRKFLDLYEFVYVNEFENLEKMCHQIVSSLRCLATEIGKKDVNVIFLPSHILVNKKEYQMLTDILIHCLRNSVDHGIESPAERISKGKPEIGKITLNVRVDEKCGIIEIEDDGAGLNLNALKEKGIESGYIKNDSSNLEIAETIFYSGISTAKRITEISGRGVGMDAAKKFVLDKEGDIRIRLNGEIDQYGKVPFSLLIYLPKEYFFDSSQSLKMAS